MIRPRGSAWVVVAALSAVVALRAQTLPPAQVPEAPSGIIIGKVVEAGSNQGIAGVVVTAADAAPAAQPSGPPTSMLTDSEGRFVFRQLPRGTYTLTTTIGGVGFSPGGFLVSGMGSPVGPYLNGAYGQRRPGGPSQTIIVSSGEVVANVTIPLWKGAAIEGTIVDETGEPLVGIAVAAVRRADGQLLTGPTTRTDDRGRYRIATLFPGEYVVVVPQTQLLTPTTFDEETKDRAINDSRFVAQAGAFGVTLAATTGVVVGDAFLATTASGPAKAVNLAALTERSGRVFIYETTYHPAARSLSNASPLRLRAGETRGAIDIKLQPVATTSISGTVSDGTLPVANFGVHLLPNGDDGTGAIEVAATMTDGTGRFRFPLVPPGTYRVLAMRKTTVTFAPTPGRPAAPPSTAIADQRGAWASRVVTVADRAIDGIDLTLQAGAQVTGRVEFAGPGEKPPANRLQRYSVAATMTPPLFRDLVGAGGAQAAPGASGEFVIRGLVNGRFVIAPAQPSAALGDWTLQSVTLAGRDITDQAIAIGDTNIADVVITFTNQPASVVGTVRGAHGGADEDAAVLLFPADRQRWPHAHWTDLVISTRLRASTFRTERVSKDGSFTINGVPPGEYLVVAAPDDATEDWPDEKLLTRLAPLGTAVRVTTGARSTVALRTVEIR